MLQPAKDSIDVGIFVRDIGPMLGFYGGVLGLEKTEEMPTVFGTIHRFRHGTSDIKLMDPKEVPPAAPNGFGKRLGIGYLTFVITGLSDLCAALEDKGVEFTIPETEIRTGTRIAMIEDPEGNILEFVERG